MNSADFNYLLLDSFDENIDGETYSLRSGKINVFHIPTGKILTKSIHTKHISDDNSDFEIMDIIFSNLNLFLFVSFHSVRIYCADTFAMIASLKLPDTYVTRIVRTDRTGHLFTLGNDYDIHIYNLSTLEKVKTIKAAKYNDQFGPKAANITDVFVFSPVDNILAVKYSYPNSYAELIFIDYETGQIINHIKSNESDNPAMSAFRNVIFSEKNPDWVYIAYTSLISSSKVAIYNWRTGEKIKNIIFDAIYLESCDISPDEKIMVCSLDTAEQCYPQKREFQVWDIEKWERLEIIPGEYGRLVKFVPEHRQMANFSAEDIQQMNVNPSPLFLISGDDPDSVYKKPIHVWKVEI